MSQDMSKPLTTLRRHKGRDLMTQSNGYVSGHGKTKEQSNDVNKEEI